MCISATELDKQMVETLNTTVKPVAGHAERLERSITACIKTFLRPECCLRLVLSIRSRYPGLPILVCNDSGPGHTESYLAVAQEQSVRMITLPFDSGISSGRNAMADAVETEYLMFLDDDMFFTAKTDLNKPLEALRRVPAADVVGGIHDPTWIMHGALEHMGKTLLMRMGKVVRVEAGYDLYDYVACSPLVARTKSARLYRWEPELKICEHIGDFAWTGCLQTHPECLLHLQNSSIGIRAS